MIVVPEAVGHSFFERAHPIDSSVNAAILFTNNLKDNHDRTGICHLTIENDPSGSNIARAAGLDGKYGQLSCL